MNMLTHWWNSIDKYLVHYNQATPAVLKSINSSSVSDDSTGHFTINYTSNFSDALYLLNSGLHENTDDADTDRGGHSVGFENGQTETTALAKHQVLSQAATAMLAQANQSKQSVLSLLQ